MKTPFTISKRLEKDINIELLLISGLVEPVNPGTCSDEEQEYCLTLDGINYCWVCLKVIREFILEKDELERFNNS